MLREQGDRGRRLAELPVGASAREGVDARVVGDELGAAGRLRDLGPEAAERAAGRHAVERRPCRGDVALEPALDELAVGAARGAGKCEEAAPGGGEPAAELDAEGQRVVDDRAQRRRRGHRGVGGEPTDAGGCPGARAGGGRGGRHAPIVPSRGA